MVTQQILVLLFQVRILVAQLKKDAPAREHPFFVSWPERRTDTPPPALPWHDSGGVSQTGRFRFISAEKPVPQREPQKQIRFVNRKTNLPDP